MSRPVRSYPFSVPSKDLPVPPWAPAPSGRRTADDGGRPMKSATRRRREQPLNLGQILDATLAIIDAEGTAAVTMRRVAADLGTSASSLYVHVRDRESLLMAVADRLFDSLPVIADSGDWRCDVKAMMCGVHRLLSAHSDISSMFFANIPTGEGALVRSEQFLTRLLAGGVPPRIAAWGIDRLILYTVADVFEGWCFSRRGLTDPGQFADEIRPYFESLPRDRFPNLTAHAEVMLSGDSQERFEMGLDMLIAGIAATAGREPRPPGPPS